MSKMKKHFKSCFQNIKELPALDFHPSAVYDAVNTNCLIVTGVTLLGANLISLIIKCSLLIPKSNSSTSVISVFSEIGSIICLSTFLLFLLRNPFFFKKYRNQFVAFTGIFLTAWSFEGGIYYEKQPETPMQNMLTAQCLLTITYAVFFCLMLCSSVYKLLYAIICFGYITIRGATLSYAAIPYGLAIGICVFHFSLKEAKVLSDHKNAWKNTVEEEQVWKKILNYLTNGVAIITKERNFYYVNPAFKEFLHQKRQKDLRIELMNLKSLQIREESAARLEELLEKADGAHLSPSSARFVQSQRLRLFKGLNDSDAIQNSVQSRKINMSELFELMSMSIDREDTTDTLDTNKPLIFDYVSEEYTVSAALGKKRVKRTYEIKMSVIKVNQVPTILILINETTESQLVNYLEESLNFKTLLFSTFSHELRTPLNAIMGLMSSGMQDPKLDQLTKIKYLEPAVSSCHILLYLVNDLLDLSLLMINKFELEMQEFNLKELVYSIQDDFLQRLSNKKVKLLVEYSEKIDEIVYSDKKRISQILYNLVGNSIKFTFEGHIKLSVYSNSSNMIEVAIEDTGIGIDSADIESIRTNIAQGLHSKLTKNAAGLGIGLRVSYLLAAHLGRPLRRTLQIDSIHGKGTRVCFFIPTDVSSVNDSQTLMRGEINSLHFSSPKWGSSPMEREKSRFYESKVIREDKIQLENASVLETVPNEQPGVIEPIRHTTLFFNKLSECSTSHLESSSCKCNTILLVDDDYYNILALQTILQMAGEKDTEHASNGEEALRQLDSKIAKKKCGEKCRGYKLILMDINMPLMNGFEATKAIHDRMNKEGCDNRTSIVGCSAFVDPETKKKGLSLGMEGFLTKPVMVKDLKQILQKLNMNH